ncbi:MAG: 23S rRNA (adenine(2503)-C(2))-methyltransferase RlmN [Deinococcota bacterium]
MPIGELPIPNENQSYRRKQLAAWVYQHGATSFDEMTNLPKAWRQSLAEAYRVDPFDGFTRFPSADKSVRYLFTLPDGKRTEAVYMPYANRKTLCISSMVGCPAGCAFCATGALGFGRNLSQAEIIGQIVAVARAEGFAPTEIRNVVLMGMGEALLNYREAVGAIRSMIDPAGLDMSPRRITLSTVGLPNKMRQLADEGLPLVLAVSLHAPDETTRKQIIPTAHAHSIADIMAAMHYWQEKIGRRMTIEYTMLEGVNDALWQADALAGLLKGMLVHVNLIPFNAWQASEFGSSSRDTIANFEDRLTQAGLSVSVRFSRGQDAGAACGQLAFQQANA